MLATDDESIIDAYRGFGWSLGIAFQLNDDLLGIWGDEQTTGKEPSDLAKHKKTLPIIYALERASATDAARLKELLATPEPSRELVVEARQILERSGARDYYARSRSRRAGRSPAPHRVSRGGRRRSP